MPLLARRPGPLHLESLLECGGPRSLSLLLLSKQSPTVRMQGPSAQQATGRSLAANSDLDYFQNLGLPLPLQATSPRSSSSVELI